MWDQLTSDVQDGPTGHALLSMDCDLIEMDTYVLREGGGGRGEGGGGREGVLEGV